MDPTHSWQRRRVLRASAGALAAALVHWSFARAADARGGLTMGLLRNPVSGLIAVTDQKGWFKEAGVDLQTTLFAGAGGPKVIQAMGGGSIALGSVSATAALLALAGNAVPLRIISISTDPAPLFVLLSEPEIDSMSKLAGRKVATTAGTGLHYFLVRALAKSGMKPSDIEFVNLPVGDAQAAFLAGRVDAVVPSLTGRYYIRSIRKDARELFTHDMFGRPPGNPARFDDYDVFVAPQSVVESSKPALRAFLAAYHGRGVPYLRSAATQNDAIAAVTRYVNAEQKSPTDEQAMREQLLRSGFFDVAEAKRIMTSDAFRAGIEDQVKFLSESRQSQGRIALDGVIVAELL